jgi:hypothetical protein
MEFTTALILAFSPGEKEGRGHVSGFADARPANPTAGIAKGAGTISPSPWGEGRDEGERSNKLISSGSAGSRAPGAPVRRRSRGGFFLIKFFAGAKSNLLK